MLVGVLVDLTRESAQVKNLLFKSLQLKHEVKYVQI